MATRRLRITIDTSLNPKGVDDLVDRTDQAIISFERLDDALESTEKEVKDFAEESKDLADILERKEDVLRDIENRYDLLGDKVKTTEEVLDKLRQRFDIVETTLEQNIDAQKRYEDRLDQTEVTTKALTNAVKDNEEALRDNEKRLEASEVRTNNLRTATQRLDVTVDRLEKETEQASEAWREYERNIDRAGDSSQSFARDLQDTFDFVNEGIEFIRNLTEVTEALFDTLLEGASVTQQADAFEFLVERAGGYADTLERLQEATRGTVSEFDLQIAASRALAGVTGFANDEFARALPQLAEYSQRISDLLPGLFTTEEAFEELTEGLKTFDDEQLRSIGLNVDFESAFRRKAEALGINREELTRNERAEIALQEVIRAGQSLLADTQGQIETTTDVWERLRANTQNATDAFKANIEEGLRPWARIATGEFQTALQAVIDGQGELDTSTLRIIARYEFARGVALRFLEVASAGLFESTAVDQIEESLRNLQITLAQNSDSAEEFGEAYQEVFAGLVDTSFTTQELNTLYEDLRNQTVQISGETEELAQKLTDLGLAQEFVTLKEELGIETREEEIALARDLIQLGEAEIRQNENRAASEDRLADARERSNRQARETFNFFESIRDSEPFQFAIEGDLRALDFDAEEFKQELEFQLQQAEPEIPELAGVSIPRQLFDEQELRQIADDYEDTIISLLTRAAKAGEGVFENADIAEAFLDADVDDLQDFIPIYEEVIQRQERVNEAFSNGIPLKNEFFSPDDDAVALLFEAYNVLEEAQGEYVRVTVDNSAKIEQELVGAQERASEQILDIQTQLQNDLTNEQREALEDQLSQLEDQYSPEALAIWRQLEGDITDNQRRNLLIRQQDLEAFIAGNIEGLDVLTKKERERVEALLENQGTVQSVYTGDIEAVREAQEAIAEAQEAIRENLRVTAFEEFIESQERITENTIELGVALGIFSQEEGKFRLEIANNVAALQELNDQFDQGEISFEEFLAKTLEITEGIDPFRAQLKVIGDEIVSTSERAANSPIEVTADASQAETEIERVEELTAKERQLEILVNVAEAEAEIDDIRKAAKSTEDEKPKIKIETNLDEVDTSVEETKAAILDLGEEEFEITVQDNLLDVQAEAVSTIGVLQELAGTYTIIINTRYTTEGTPPDLPPTAPEDTGPSGQPFALGGLAVGGVWGTDSILARLTPGEYVLPPALVNTIGVGNLEKLRHGDALAIRSVVDALSGIEAKTDISAGNIRSSQSSPQHFQTGGLVLPMPTTATSSPFAIQNTFQFFTRSEREAAIIAERTSSIRRENRRKLIGGR